MLVAVRALLLGSNSFFVRWVVPRCFVIIKTIMLKTIKILQNKKKYYVIIVWQHWNVGHQFCCVSKVVCDSNCHQNSYVDEKIVDITKHVHHQHLALKSRSVLQWNHIFLCQLVAKLDPVNRWPETLAQKLRCLCE